MMIGDLDARRASQRQLNSVWNDNTDRVYQAENPRRRRLEMMQTGRSRLSAVVAVLLVLAVLVTPFAAPSRACG